MPNKKTPTMSRKSTTKRAKETERVSFAKPKMNPIRAPTATRIPDYLRCLIDPFNSTAVHIPDADVAKSGLVTSRKHIRSNLQALAGTSTTHSAGFTMTPYP